MNCVRLSINELDNTQANLLGSRSSSMALSQLDAGVRGHLRPRALVRMQKELKTVVLATTGQLEFVLRFPIYES